MAFKYPGVLCIAQIVFTIGIEQQHWNLHKSSCRYNIEIVFSLQAYTSVSKASLGLADHRELGKMMNTIIFHTKMVDSLVEMLVETSDLSIFWYAAKLTVQVIYHLLFGLSLQV